MNYNKTILLCSVIVCLGFFYCSENRQPLPDEFNDLKLTKKLTGKLASDYVNRLHFNPVSKDKNEVGFYSGNKGSAVIYITYYSSNEAAGFSYKKMTEKISPENSVFIRSEFVELGGKNIYRCFGMGQMHYVFFIQNKLFWVSSDPEFSNDFITAYLEYLNSFN